MTLTGLYLSFNDSGRIIFKFHDPDRIIFKPSLHRVRTGGQDGVKGSTCETERQRDGCHVTGLIRIQGQPSSHSAEKNKARISPAASRADESALQPVCLLLIKGPSQRKWPPFEMTETMPLQCAALRTLNGLAPSNLNSA
jgi:hypothetical protein